VGAVQEQKPEVDTYGDTGRRGESTRLGYVAGHLVVSDGDILMPPVYPHTVVDHRRPRHALCVGGAGPLCRDCRSGVQVAPKEVSRR
jgi:hypothetical protein